MKNHLHKCDFYLHMLHHVPGYEFYGNDDFYRYKKLRNVGTDMGNEFSYVYAKDIQLN